MPLFPKWQQSGKKCAKQNKVSNCDQRFHDDRKFATKARELKLCWQYLAIWRSKIPPQPSKQFDNFPVLAARLLCIYFLLGNMFHRYLCSVHGKGLTFTCSCQSTPTPPKKSYKTDWLGGKEKMEPTWDTLPRCG